MTKTLDWTGPAYDFKASLPCRDMDQYLSLHYYIGELHFNPENDLDLEAAHELALIKATANLPVPYRSRYTRKNWESRLYRHKKGEIPPACFAKYVAKREEIYKYYGDDRVYLPPKATEFLTIILRLIQTKTEEEIARELKEERRASSLLYNMRVGLIENFTDPKQQPYTFFVVFMMILTLIGG